MSTIVAIAAGWTLVSAVALRFMMSAGLMSSLADQAAEQVAGQLLYTHGMRLVVSNPENRTAQAVCPQCAILVQGSYADEPCLACNTPMIELPSIGPVTFDEQRREHGHTRHAFG